MKQWVLIIEFFSGGSQDSMAVDIPAYLDKHSFKSILVNRDVTVYSGSADATEAYSICKYLIEAYPLTIHKIIPIYGYVNSSLKLGTL